MRAARGGLAFSHLFFVDDLVLFSKADQKNYQSICDVLEVFCGLSGQKVSNKKSKVYFSLNVHEATRIELCSTLGFQPTLNLGKYLGFPLKQPSSSSHDYNFNIEKVQSKLAGWKGHLLSFAVELC